MKLLGKVRQTIRQRHYSHQTEKSYIGWIKRYVLFQNKRHPKDMGKLEIEAFLTALANDGVAATTQNQAFNAIMFLYNQVLGISVKDKNIQALRTKRKRAYPCYLIKRRERWLWLCLFT